MPPFLKAITERFSAKNTAPANRYEGFKESGAVVLRDRRGTIKAEIPQVSEKSMTLGGDDPLAIWKPTGAKTVSAAKAMANFTGWTYAAVNAVASEIANVQLRLYAVNGKDHIEQKEHELMDLLDGVNDTMTGVELKYLLAAHLDLTGNAYLFLDGVTDQRSKPRAIYPLNPGKVTVKVDKTQFPYRISHYEYTLDGRIFRFEPYQILHIKYPDPNDPFVGIGIPQTIPTWIDSDNYAMEYNRKFFVNGANIGLYIQTDTNVEGNIDRIRRGFNNRHEGVENAHKVPVLPKGVKLEHTGLSQKDMDFATLTDATRDRILAAFRVSKTILGTAESDTNRATAETADYVFSKRTIKPKMMLIVAYLNEFLVPRYGDNLYLTFIDPVPEDRQYRTQEMEAATAGLPIMTQNEARRAYLGLGPIEGGDQLMRPIQMEPAGQTATVEGEDQAPQLAKVLTASGQYTEPVRIRTGGKTSYSGTAKLRQLLLKAFSNALEKQQSDITSKSINELTKEEYGEHWKRFAYRTDMAVEQLHAVFRGINAKQRKDVIDNLPDSTGVRKALGDLFDLKEWIGITVDLVTPILLGLTKDEATAALAMIGADHTDILAEDSVREELDRSVAKMARSYNETTLDQLKKTLTDELNNPDGTSLEKLTNAVDGVYSFADERRAKLIAQTESYRAANWANKEAWKQSGVVKSIRWYTAEDGHVCEFCQAMEDKGPIPVDDNFVDSGASVSGADGGVMTADYGAVEAPPIHPACRCYIRPDVIS